jgi:xanthine dehydrogenase accessory factor
LKIFDDRGGFARPSSRDNGGYVSSPQMKLEPNKGLSARDPLAVSVALAQARRRFALAIVVEAKGSTAARSGAKALFDSDGELLAGWVGGGCAQSTVAHAAVVSFKTGASQIVDVDLDDEVLGAGMPCGGHMKVYVEPVIPPPVIWILGHGGIAESLSKLGTMMGFEIVVVDSTANREEFPDAHQILGDDDGYASLTPAIDDFVVVATQHRGDHQSLSRLLMTDVGYIALIASSKRAGLVMEYLRNAGLGEIAVNRIRAPCGLELGARTAEEIALSVMSEIVLIRRTRLHGSVCGAPASKGGLSAAD